MRPVRKVFRRHRSCSPEVRSNQCDPLGVSTAFISAKKQTPRIPNEGKENVACVLQTLKPRTTANAHKQYPAPRAHQRLPFFVATTSSSTPCISRISLQYYHPQRRLTKLARSGELFNYRNTTISLCHTNDYFHCHCRLQPCLSSQPENWRFYYSHRPDRRGYSSHTT